MNQLTRVVNSKVWFLAQRTNAHPLVLAKHALSIWALMERRPCVSLSEPDPNHSQNQTACALSV